MKKLNRKEARLVACLAENEPMTANELHIKLDDFISRTGVDGYLKNLKRNGVVEVCGKKEIEINTSSMIHGTSQNVKRKVNLWRVKKY